MNKLTKLNKLKRVLAFDFGASSGRAIIGVFDGKTISLEEIHRFSNDPVEVCGTLYWDTLRQLYEIKQGLIKAHLSGGFDSIGIDTWGVDFGLLDENGNLLESAVHYRDTRTKGIMEQSFQSMPRERLYQITGNQFMEINTVFQLYALKKLRPKLLEQAQILLMTPDLFNYFLTGVKSTEYTIASTTQMLDAHKQDWSEEILHSLGIPRQILTPIVQSGTVIGKLQSKLCTELNIPSADVISVASHDTQSAVTAVPTLQKDFIFLSCGTWSLMGTELCEPLINEHSLNCNLTNEGGISGTTTFLKNIIGLWLIQESRRQWQREGNTYSYAQLEEMALQAKPFCSFIDPDAQEFIPQGNIPQRIKDFCKNTNQPVPDTVGEIMQCIYQSLTLKYRYALEQIQYCTNKSYDTIYVVGGGVKDRLLCQMTANACNCVVSAGPIEATVLGNIVVQLMATGDIHDLNEARQIIARSGKANKFEPYETSNWETAYAQFKHIIIK